MQWSNIRLREAENFYFMRVPGPIFMNSHILKTYLLPKGKDVSFFLCEKRDIIDLNFNMS